MKKIHTKLSRQVGFSLIELMVSIAIGLVIMIAIGVVYVNSSNINRQKEDLADINEPIKVVTNLLKYNISVAGYIDPFDGATADNLQGATLFTPGSAALQNVYARSATVATSISVAVTTPLEQFFGGLRPVFGCDGAMNSTPNALANAATPLSLTCSATVTATSNSLQLAYQAIAATAAGVPLASVSSANATTGEGRDCLQQSLPTGTTTPAGSFIVINRFYIAANSSDSVNELYCAGSGNATPQPIARGVEEFVVRYQMAPGAAAGATAAGNSKTQFLTATQVGNNWPNVVAIEVCMVTATVPSRGAAAIGTAELQTTRPTCERQTAVDAFKSNISRTAGDARLWKRSTFTYTVRNAVFAPST